MKGWVPSFRLPPQQNGLKERKKLQQNVDRTSTCDANVIQYVTKSEPVLTVTIR